MTEPQLKLLISELKANNQELQLMRLEVQHMSRIIKGTESEEDHQKKVKAVKQTFGYDY